MTKSRAGNTAKMLDDASGRARRTARPFILLDFRRQLKGISNKGPMPAAGARAQEERGEARVPCDESNRRIVGLRRLPFSVTRMICIVDIKL